MRIGIIGTENSHALHFAKSINLSTNAAGERKYPDMEVVALYGPDVETALRVQKEANVKQIVDAPEDFIGLVDAMMITSRHGSVQSAYATPFLELGIPTFIDKPFTSSPQEAKALIQLAKDKDVLITGGSGCK